MMRWIAAPVLVLAIAAPALADPAADVKAVSDAFEKAMAAGDAAAVVALYRDDASVVWPGRGEEAKGKAAIEKMVKAALASAPKDLKIVQKSNEAIPLDADHIANVGRWEQSYTTPAGKHVTEEIRTTEVLAKTGGQWRYLVDHASVGQAPPPSPRRGRRRHG